ncbi:hypothetical protein [Demequina sp.]|nr:hypothetical protein [Demequina sp.]
MNDAVLIAHWSEVYARPVSGGDFSELEGVTQEDAPWSYEE